MFISRYVYIYIYIIAIFYCSILMEQIGLDTIIMLREMDTAADKLLYQLVKTPSITASRYAQPTIQPKIEGLYSSCFLSRIIFFPIFVPSLISTAYTI